MNISRVVPGVFRIRFPDVNAFVVDGGDDGVALVDTGSPGRAADVAAAVVSLGWALSDVRHILVTHCHADHAGALADLKVLTGARVHMHVRDAALVAQGRGMRRLVPAPGWVNRWRFRQVRRLPTTFPPARVEAQLHDRDEIPFAGGIQAIHTPGHTEGHVAFLLRKSRVLFVGDAAANIFGQLGLMMAYEHVRQGLHSLRHLSRLDFEVACFGHGPPILSSAAARFRRLWGAEPRPRP